MLHPPCRFLRTPLSVCQRQLRTKWLRNYTGTFVSLENRSQKQKALECLSHGGRPDSVQALLRPRSHPAITARSTASTATTAELSITTSTTEAATATWSPATTTTTEFTVSPPATQTATATVSARNLAEAIIGRSGSHGRRVLLPRRLGIPALARLVAGRTLKARSIVRPASALRLG